MSFILQLTIIVVLAAIAVTLVPLLLQMRRTARGMEIFLESSQQTLTAIAEDIHATCHRMNAMADSVQDSLDELSTFASLLGDAGRSVKNFQARIQSGFECASRNWGGLIGGVSSVLAIFKRKPHPSTTELGDLL